MPTAHSSESILATCTPGASLKISGIDVAPDLLISSSVMTYDAAELSKELSSHFDADEILIFISSSNVRSK